MLSIIISTYKSDFLETLKNSIAETIDVIYEIIAIENKGTYGICEAYNLGAERSMFPYLCFVHEDILFKTKNWSSRLINQFEVDIQTGLIGVAGTTYKSLSPGGWNNEQKETNRIQILQHYKNDGDPRYDNSIQKDFEQVVCIDGVFLFTKRSIWLENKFDENTFKDFHCYDLDFSLSINRNYKVYVTNQVLLEHYSSGSLNEKWVTETIKLSKKWSKALPAATSKLNKELQYHIEWKQKIWFLTQMIRYKFNFGQVLNIYLGFGFLKFFSIVLNLKAFKAILFCYLKLK